MVQDEEIRINGKKRGEKGGKKGREKGRRIYSSINFNL